MTKEWECIACGEAENVTAGCKIEVWAGMPLEPVVCPVTGDEVEWYPVKD